MRSLDPSPEREIRSDADLVVAARTDAGAFRELYDRYAGRVYGYHLRRSHDADAAHDLTAETFAQAWLARMRFRDEADGSAAPWLFGIARNVLAVSVRRRTLERSACERLGVLDRLDGAAASAEPDEGWLDGVDEALADLPEAQRAAIRMRVVDDLAYEQIADRCDTTAETARARVSRGLTTLRTRLSDSKEEPMTELPRRLSALGAALEQAAAADLEAGAKVVRRRRPGARRIAIAAAALAVAVPGVAIAAAHFTSTGDVAASMPAGTLALAGTESTCTVVRANVEFHCTLAKAPTGEVSDWKDTVEPTVDRSKLVNGGCRSLTSDGRDWECYLGQAAVDQHIISAGFLGASAPVPGVG